MPYINVDIFQEKNGLKLKNLKAIEFNKKWVKNIHSRLFLLSFNSKLSHFDKNLNLNHKWFSSTVNEMIAF
jgi:hypothetical protein